jgi:hypothetical protein
MIERAKVNAIKRQDRTMVISFRGLPPHDLGLAETGSARAANGMVEVMLQALDDWHSPPGNLVRLRMSASLARSLAASLNTAAEDAERNETRRRE